MFQSATRSAAAVFYNNEVLWNATLHPRALIKLFPDLKRFASMNALIISLHCQVLFAYLYLKLF